jgi:quinol monooxygenase YgiN
MVKEGKLDQYLALSKKLRACVLQEKGCVEYTFALEFKSIIGHQEKVCKNRVTLIEKWETKKDLAAHTQAPHMKEFGPKLAALREGVTSRVMVTA